VGHPGDGVTHRWADWAPCLPGKSQGSLNNESWSDVSDRIDGWWNQNFHRRISESGPWSHEQSNTKSNSNTKTFHEEGSQNPSRVHVSLDNADTVIEGGPAYRFPLTLEGAPSKLRLGGGASEGTRQAGGLHTSCSAVRTFCLPPFSHKTRKDGAPPALLVPARSEPKLGPLTLRG